MDQLVKKEWVKALRSGDFKQGRGALLKNEKYCCLGVLCEIAEDVGFDLEKRPNTRFPNLINFGEDNAFLPPIVALWSELDSCNPSVNEIFLSRHNDAGDSFKEIADLIEKYL